MFAHSPPLQTSSTTHSTLINPILFNIYPWLKAEFIDLIEKELNEINPLPNTIPEEIEAILFFDLYYSGHKNPTVLNGINIFERFRLFEIKNKESAHYALKQLEIILRLQIFKGGNESDHLKQTSIILKRFLFFTSIVLALIYDLADKNILFFKLHVGNRNLTSEEKTQYGIPSLEQIDITDRLRGQQIDDLNDVIDLTLIYPGMDLLKICETFATTPSSLQEEHLTVVKNIIDTTKVPLDSIEDLKNLLLRYPNADALKKAGLIDLEKSTQCFIKNGFVVLQTLLMDLAQARRFNDNKLDSISLDRSPYPSSPMVFFSTRSITDELFTSINHLINGLIEHYKTFRKEYGSAHEEMLRNHFTTEHEILGIEPLSAENESLIDRPITPKLR